MSTQITDVTAIKLHTDLDGIVWFADGERMPISSGQDANDFVLSLRDRTQPHIRLIGNHANASLIMRLRSLVAENKGKIEVASPLIVGSLVERNEPDIALYQMRCCDLPASVGGWHELTDLDYATYALITQLNRDRAFLETSEHLLLRHPVWKYLSFVHGLSPEWAAWLIVTVIDPRWYADPNNPGRVSKLKAFLGLTPVDMAITVNGDEAVRTSTMKCRIVYSAWCANGIDIYQLDGPSLFIQRVYQFSGGKVKGALRASQKFVEFMYFSWIQAIHASTTRYSGAQSLFSPDMMFKSAEEINAFKQHTS